MFNLQDAFSGSRNPVGPALTAAEVRPGPDPTQVKTIALLLKALDVHMTAHGYSPFRLVSILEPDNQKEYFGVLGLIGQLLNPDLSDTDYDNMARQIITEDPDLIPNLIKGAAKVSWHPGA